MYTTIRFYRDLACFAYINMYTYAYTHMWVTHLKKPFISVKKKNEVLHCGKVVQCLPDTSEALDLISVPHKNKGHVSIYN